MVSLGQEGKAREKGTRLVEDGEVRVDVCPVGAEELRLRLHVWQRILCPDEPEDLGFGLDRAVVCRRPYSRRWEAPEKLLEALRLGDEVQARRSGGT